MTPDKRTKRILAGADALSVACDQLDEVSTPEVAARAAQLAAETYREAAQIIDRDEGLDAARDAYADASIHFERAELALDAMRTRGKALRGLDHALRLSLNGVPVGEGAAKAKKRAAKKRSKR